MGREIGNIKFKYHSFYLKDEIHKFKLIFLAYLIIFLPCKEALPFTPYKYIYI